MKFGVREICDVVLKAKANQKIGNKIFYKNEPVIYFDTLKTSSMEGAATTVYAQGGRGNSRLVAWEGERTVTFTMEDALISPAGFMILSGAGLIEASKEEVLKIHTTETTDDVAVSEDNKVTITLKEKPYFTYKDDGSAALKKSDAIGELTADTQYSLAGENYIYVMLMENGEVVSEPYIPEVAKYTAASKQWTVTLKASDDLFHDPDKTPAVINPFGTGFAPGVPVLVDYYAERSSGAQQIEITPDKFGGNYYLEASTLFRDTNGVDMPAEFIIPNCKIQSNFTFTMASSGDPSTFTFTMDAFPDYTRFDQSKKVLAAIQIISDSIGGNQLARESTKSEHIANESGFIVEDTATANN